MLNIIQNTIGALARIGLSVIRNGLKLWLPFENSGSDSSGNSNNATLYTGKALSFDGVNDYVDLDGFQMSGSNTTLAFWVNPDDINSSSIDAIFDVDDDRFLIGFNNSNLSILQVSPSVTWTEFGTISNNVWQRVVITVSGTTAICYRNGVQLGTTKTLPQSVDWSNAANVRIGSMYDGTASGFYDGELSDFQIYNTVWTQADVTFDYDNPQHLVTDRAASSIALSNLKGYWHLSEGDGAINYDSSGEDNDGTISGATWSLRQATIPQLGLMDWSKPTIGSDVVTLISDPNDPSEDILGNDVRLREHSLNLDGSGYAKVDSDSSLDITNYSIDGWIYNTNNTVNWETILVKHTQNNFQILVENSNLTYYSEVASGGSGTKTLASVSLNAWTYFCITESSGTLKCYINDDSTPKFDESVNPRFATSGHIYIGSKGIGDYSNALIDDIRVYNGVLSADEVEQNYKAGLNQHKTGSSFSDDFSSDYGF